MGTDGIRFHLLGLTTAQRDARAALLSQLAPAS
jgi:hypothetical protein